MYREVSIIHVRYYCLSKRDLQSGSCNFKVFNDEQRTVGRSSFSHGSVLVGSEKEEVFFWKNNRRVCNGLLVRCVRRESIRSNDGDEFDVAGK